LPITYLLNSYSKNERERKKKKKKIQFREEGKR